MSVNYDEILNTALSLPPGARAMLTVCLKALIPKTRRGLIHSGPKRPREESRR